MQLSTYMYIFSELFFEKYVLQQTIKKPLKAMPADQRLLTPHVGALIVRIGCWAVL